MTLTAHVRGGRIVLDDPVPLPEGAALRLRVLEKGDGAQKAGVAPAAPGGAAAAPTLLDALADIVGCVDDLPPDAAGSVDQALYSDRP